MKTILIPTDFSPAADNALHYGARLAQQAEADILLLHVYTIPITVNEIPVMTISGDELKRIADEGLLHSKEELVKTYPTLSIRTESRLGNTLDEITEVCKTANPFAIVMGTHGTNKLERTLFGSTAAAAMRRFTVPVFIIPMQYQFSNVHTVVLATDLQKADHLAVQQITDVVQLFGAQLQVVHVYEDEKKKQAPNDVLNQLQILQPRFIAIQNENIIEGLQSYLDEEKADLLIVLPHEHSWFERFMFKLHAERITRHISIPVVSIRC
ncbi:MAG: universal stress protein [Flavisolibacter sp.]|nr:universal stress protein [Flavisolibacter sp.]